MIFHLFNTIIIYLLLGISETIIGIFILATLIPSSAVCVRRLHDVGKSGYFAIGAYLLPTAFILYSTMVQTPDYVFFLLLLLAVFIYSIWFIVVLFKNSQPGDNSYGPNPKTESNTQSLMVE